MNGIGCLIIVINKTSINLLHFVTGICIGNIQLHISLCCAAYVAFLLG